MSNKTKTEYQGVTDTSQNFMNFFDNLSKSNFSQNTKGSMTGTADTTQHGATTNVGTSDMTSAGTSDSKGTSTGTTTTANTYGFMGDTDTADITAYRAALQDQNKSDPSIKYGAAAAMRSAKNRYAGPFGAGAGSSAATRQQMFKSEEGGIREQEGENLVKDAFNRRQQQLGGMATLAGLTKRSLVQTGGTSTSSGTTQQSGVTSGTQTGKTSNIGTSDMTSNTKTAQDTDSTTTGTSESESAGVGGGSQTGHQAESGSQTTSTPMWGQLLGGAAQVGAAAATKGA